MSATDGAPSLCRALRAGVAALCVACNAQAAPVTPPTVTEADIERARQQHRMTTDAMLDRVPVPAAARIEALPQPATHVPLDLEAIAKGFDLHTGASPSLIPGKATPKVLIFVSFAMPEATFRRLLDQAARAGAALVLRGLLNGSMRDTVTRIRALIGSRRVGVHIDPEAFDRYAVTSTPTFVLAFDDTAIEACASRACRPTELFVKVSGDVTLEYAMQYLTRRSHGAREVSKGR